VDMCGNLQNTNVLTRSALRVLRPEAPQARPSALVLRRRIDRSSKFQSRPQHEVRVPDELSPKKYDVRLAFLQVAVGLFTVEDESDGADVDLRNYLLNTIGEEDLSPGV
jgi:hypothetical protein